MDNETYYMRNPQLVVLTSGDGVLFVGSDGSSTALSTSHGASWSRLLQMLAGPTDGATLNDAMTGMPIADHQLLDRLLEGDLLLQDRAPEPLRARLYDVFQNNTGLHMVPQQPVCQNLVVGCTGSVVAGLIAPTLLSLSYSRFQQRLDVVLSQAAQKFMTRDLLESYGVRTWVDGFERREDIYVPHVHLARDADCVLILPASANVLHRIADGACTDLLSTLVAATKAPVVMAPVMNDAMWNFPAVQRNVQRLREDGFYIIEPTVIFGAADMASQGQPMYGGHGTLWSGPRSLMHALEALLQTRAGGVEVH